MNRLAFYLVLTLSSYSFAEEVEGGVEDLVSLMVTAKATGACGMLQQMVSFQNSTKMKGGDEFMARFISMEMARLNKTHSEYLAECQAAIESYNMIMGELGHN